MRGWVAIMLISMLMPQLRAGAVSGGGMYVEPSNFTLELVAPRASGTAPSALAGTPNMPSGHFSLFAKSGVPYRFRAVVMFGSYPYNFSLTNAPSGMTIDADTGLIEWPSPAGLPVTPTINVTDAEGTEISEPWTIADATIRVIDSDSGNNANAGTLAAPWQTLAYAYANAPSGSQLIFRAGAYTLTGITRSGDDTTTTSTVDTSAFTPTIRAYETTDLTATSGDIVVFTDGPAAGTPVYIDSVSSQGGGTRLRITTYADLPGIPATGNTFKFKANWVHVNFSAASRPVKFAAFPGEAVTLDLGFVSFASGDWGAHLRLTGSSTYPYFMSGITILNGLHIGAQFPSGVSDYNHLQDVAVNDIYYTIDGANSSGLMYQSEYGDQSSYSSIQSLTTSNISPGPYKLYSQRKHLSERNLIDDCGYGPDWKADVDYLELRDSTFTNITAAGATAGYHGNMNASGTGHYTSGEIRYNYFDGAANAAAMAVSADSGITGAIYVYRNTARGAVNAGNLDSSDSITTFYSNVIVNANSGSTDRITQTNITDASKLVLSNNVSGADDASIIDASGNLTGASLTSFGPATATPRGREYA